MMHSRGSVKNGGKMYGTIDQNLVMLRRMRDELQGILGAMGPKDEYGTHDEWARMMDQKPECRSLHPCFPLRTFRQLAGMFVSARPLPLFGSCSDFRLKRPLDRHRLGWREVLSLEILRRFAAGNLRKINGVHRHAGHAEIAA